MVNKTSNSDFSDKLFPKDASTEKPIPGIPAATNILKDAGLKEIPLDEPFAAEQVNLIDSEVDGKVNTVAGQMGIIPQSTKEIDPRAVMLDIRASLEKTPVTQMSDADLQTIADYILKNRSALQEMAKSSPGGVVYQRVGLPRAVQFDADGRVLIHFNKGSLGDKILGEGSYKRVRVAMDFDSKILYAVASSVIEKNEDRIITERESKFFKKLAGKPCIAQIIKEVQVIGVGGVKKSFSIQPIYNQGMLDDSVETLTQKEKCKVILDLLKGLACLEEENIIHRDIKLENVLLQKEPDGSIGAYITDFGLSCMTDEEDEKKNLAGTLEYADPERTRARHLRSSVASATSPKVDMWAFGVLVYTLAYDRFPFPELSPEKMMKYMVRLYRKTDDIYPLPQSGPIHPVQSLINNCLKPEPKDRISAKEALAKFGPQFEALI